MKEMMLVAVVGLSLILTGCEVERYAKTEVIEGYLQTPQGKFPFENTGYSRAKEMNLRYVDWLRYSYVVADAGSIKVVYNPLDGRSNFRIAVVASENDRVLLDIKKSATSFSEGVVTQPMFERMYDNKVVYLRPSFVQDETEYGYLVLEGKIPQGIDTDKIYTFHAPFSVDGVEFVAHLKFQKSIKKRLEFMEIGVPAMP